MTRRLITIKPQESLKDVEDGMEMFRFRHLPVVDDEGTLVGLITHRDMLHASSSFLSSEREKRDTLIHEQARAEMVMRKEVLTVQPDKPLADAAKLLWDNKLGCLPVTDDNNKLIGIITEADFVKLATL